MHMLNLPNRLQDMPAMEGSRMKTEVLFLRKAVDWYMLSPNPQHPKMKPPREHLRLHSAFVFAPFATKEQGALDLFLFRPRNHRKGSTASCPWSCPLLVSRSLLIYSSSTYQTLGFRVSNPQMDISALHISIPRRPSRLIRLFPAINPNQRLNTLKTILCQLPPTSTGHPDAYFHD
jgi:hypothetical protein